MNWLTIVLRLVHVTAGVFWAGAALTVIGFVAPTAKDIGPEGGRFIQRLTGARRLPVYMSLGALLTTLTGLWLYWRASGALQPGWITTGVGMGFTVGGLAGVIAFVVGMIVQEPAARRMAAIGMEIQSAGGPPSPALLAEMQALQERIGQGGLWTVAMLVVCVLAMSVAQYLGG